MNKSEYLRFEDSRLPTPGRKTRTVDIISERSNKRLGQIRWYSRWRQYTFHPDALTIWNPQCLKQISDEIDKLNRQHREKLRAEHAKTTS